VGVGSQAREESRYGTGYEGPPAGHLRPPLDGEGPLSASAGETRSLLPRVISVDRPEVHANEGPIEMQQVVTASYNGPPRPGRPQTPTPRRQAYAASYSL
jgi:hypothetical protein